MAGLFGGSMLMAALAAGAGGSGAAHEPVAAPIHLVAETAGEGVRLKVVGASNTAVDASYALEVTTDAKAGRNHSTQRGTVRLRPGVEVTLLTMTLGNVRGGEWSARLNVRPAGAEEYDEVKTSS